MKIYLCGVKSENRSVAGTDKGRRADQKSSIPKSERLTSVFLPLQPEKSPFHQQIACDCRWNGDFSGASRLCGSKLARKNRPKQRDLLGFSGHPKQKRHIIKRIPPPNTAFYADVGNPTPHRPTHTRTVRSHARIKKQPRQPSCTVIRAYIKKNLISLLKTT